MYLTHTRTGTHTPSTIPSQQGPNWEDIEKAGEADTEEVGSLFHTKKNKKKNKKNDVHIFILSLKISRQTLYPGSWFISGQIWRVGVPIILQKIKKKRNI
jgi:hypothetical protein